MFSRPFHARNETRTSEYVIVTYVTVMINNVRLLLTSRKGASFWCSYLTYLYHHHVPPFTFIIIYIDVRRKFPVYNNTHTYTTAIVTVLLQ